MSGTELLSAIQAAPNRTARRQLLERFAQDYAARPEFPALLRKLPGPARLTAAAKALTLVPDTPAAVTPILDALAAGLGKSGTLQRYIDLQSRIETCATLDAVVSETTKRTKLRCPKCDAKLSRPTLIRHLWFKHRLIFERGRAREPGPLVERAMARAVADPDPAAIDHVYELAAVSYRTVEPIQIHQAITARQERDPEELEPLKQAAREHHAGLCPRCLGRVANPVPPLPPPLIVARGRLTGEGFEHHLDAVSADRRRGMKWALPMAGLTLLATLALPSSVLPPLVTLAIGAPLTGAGYLLARSRRTPVNPDDLVVDRAWRDLVPRVGRSPAAVRFLTRLCRSSLDHGSTGSRSDLVWGQVEQAAILSGKSAHHMQWFAAVRVLQAHDAGQIGQDWIPSLVGILAPLFRAEASPAYAEAVAETLIDSHVLTDRDAARLRIALAGEAFAAGLTPADLAALDLACPHLDRLFAGNDAWFRALHAVWRGRNRRGWDSVGEAKTAFEFAANPSAGGTLAAFPDTLLIDVSFSRELGPVLIGRRGVTVVDATVSELNTAIGVAPGPDDGSVLTFGPHTITTRRKLPKNTAAVLTGWLQYREELLAVADKPSALTERLAMILAPVVADCPLCRQRFLARTGEVGQPWPLV